MYGNLSQNVVQVPYMFQILSNLSSEKFKKTRYRELPLLDTFSQMKKVNSRPNKRYFRINDHFKLNVVYRNLNYNNNKRYISPVTKLGQIENLQNFFDNTSRMQFTSYKNKGSISMNSSKSMINEIINDTNYNDNNKKCSENNRYNNKNGEKNNIIDDTTDNQNNNEKKDETLHKNNNYEEEETNIKKYMNKLYEKKPKNLSEMKELLDMNYMNYMNDTKIDDKKRLFFPEIKGMHRSISQEDLFMKSLDKKIESLTTIKPSVKMSLYKRKKNIILKRDYDLFQKYHGNPKVISLSKKYNIKNYSFLQ